MNKGDFFVMLTTQNGSYTPLIVEEDENNESEIAKFETQKKAEEAANNSALGAMFGFEVFEIGCGCI